MSLENIPYWIDLFFSYSATPLFFMMSAFLIWGSTGKTKNFKEHCVKRFLRIYPELWVAVFIELLILILLYHEPIHWGQFGLFAFTQSTIFQFWTPDCLRGYGCGTPNGSLWTICVLIQFYFIVYFVYKWLHGKKNYVWILSILFSLGLSFILPIIRETLPNVLGKLLGQTILPYLWIFLLASYASEKKAYILPFAKKYFWLMFLLMLLIRYTGLDFKASYSVLFTSSMFIFLVGIAYLLPQIDLKTDISYGIYLYHMTIVNAFISLGLINNPWLIIPVLLITCILAWLSSLTIGKWTKGMREVLLRKLSC